MNPEEKNDTPIRIRKYAGVTIFFNPGWILEAKFSTRPILVLRHKVLSVHQQNILIVHSLVKAYHIPLQCIEHYQPHPSSDTIAFRMHVTWHIKTESNCAEHVIRCFEKHHLKSAHPENEKNELTFSYKDVERVEHSDGTVLWQKQR